ncbi:MAG: methylmalonyl Co-A mutase-associated GTPase MeaB, partial [Candidatus Acidiferrales bacterium]
VMEIADVFVINKADRGDTERLEAQLKAMLSLSRRADGWAPPVVKTVATEGTGAPELTEAVDGFVRHLDNAGLRDEKRVERWQQRLLDLIRQQALDRVLRSSHGPEQLAEAARQVAHRQRDPYSVVADLLRSAGMTD